VSEPVEVNPYLEKIAMNLSDARRIISRLKDSGALARGKAVEVIPVSVRPGAVAGEIGGDYRYVLRSKNWKPQRDAEALRKRIVNSNDPAAEAIELAMKGMDLSE